MFWQLVVFKYTHLKKMIENTIKSFYKHKLHYKIRSVKEKEKKT